jgi:hypothetical protein
MYDPTPKIQLSRIGLKWASIGMCLMPLFAACPVRGDDVCEQVCRKTIACVKTVSCSAPFNCSTNTDCSLQDKCVQGCRNTDATLTQLVSDFQSWQTKARDRLDSDFSKAKDAVTAQVTTSAALADTEAKAAQTEVAAQLNAGLQQAQTNTRAAQQNLEALRTQRRLLRDGVAAQLTAAQSCLAAPLPTVVTHAYNDVTGSIAGWLGRAERARFDADRAIDARVKTAHDDLLSSVTAAQQLVDALKPTDALETTRGTLKQTIDSSPDRSIDNLRAAIDVLKGYANNGFDDLNTARDTAINTVKTDYQQLADAWDQAKSNATQAGASLATGLTQNIQTALAQAPTNPIADNVPTLANLRTQLRASTPEWPKVVGCLCQSVGILPGPPPGTSDGNDLERLTDALCIGNLMSHSFGQAPQRLSVTPPISSDALKNAANVPNAFQELEKKAKTYSDWTESIHEHDKIVLQCAEVVTSSKDHMPGSGPVGACNDEHTIANSGQFTGKLLAARAYQYGIAMANPAGHSAGELQALKHNLEESLTGMYNILMLTSAGECPLDGSVPEDRICGTAYNRYGTDVQSFSSVAGMPVRGYAAFVSVADTVQNVPLQIPGTLHPVQPAGSHTGTPAGSQGAGGIANLQVGCPSTNRNLGAPPYLIGDDLFSLKPTENNQYDANHRFYGHLLGFPGKHCYMFEERDSGDDTFATLLGLTAAYDVLTQLHDTGPWRARIVDAAERFGNFYANNDLRMTHRDGSAMGNDKEWPPDPLRYVQNLAWLRSVVYLSEDFHHSSSFVNVVKEKYCELAPHPELRRGGCPDLSTKPLPDNSIAGVPALAGLAALFSDPHMRPVWRPWFRWFYPSFNSEYWVLSNYLLVRYESDPVLKLAYHDLFVSVVAPLVEDYRVPLHMYAMLASVPDDPGFLQGAEKTRAQAIADAAANLYAYRNTPEPFGNPWPDAANKSYLSKDAYYTDFYALGSKSTPQYYALRDEVYYWIVIQIANDPVLVEDIQNALKEVKIDFQSEKVSDRGGALFPLGPGLVPPWNLYAYSLVGGKWDQDNHSLKLFGKDYAINGQTAKTVLAWHQEDYPLTYWFGRYHGFLPSGSELNVVPRP